MRFASCPRLVALPVEPTALSASCFGAILGAYVVDVSSEDGFAELSRVLEALVASESDEEDMVLYQSGNSTRLSRELG